MPNLPIEAKRRLLHGVGLAALELLLLGVGSLALSSITSCLWIWIVETNFMATRTHAVTRKEMNLSDTKMGPLAQVL